MTKEYFKDIRLFLGMTQKQYSKWLGVSLSTVGMIENGQRVVSDNIRAKIALKFEVTEDFLRYRERKSELCG